MTGLSWLYGDGERRWCEDCGEVFPTPESTSEGQHDPLACTASRYGDNPDFERYAWRPVPAVRLP